VSTRRLARRGLERLVDLVPISPELLREVAEPIADDLPSVDELRDLLGGEGAPADLETEGLLGGSGRVPRLRTLLVALAARAAGAHQVDTELQHAAEMLHLALVVHDVALGRSGGRRRRVARRLVRRSTDWLAGNHFSLRALELVRHAPSPEIMGDAVDTLREFSQGQALSREVQEGLTPTRSDWREHADAHTGALFAFCCRAGARLGADDPAVVSALGRYGRHVGRECNVAQDVSVLSVDGGEHLVERALVGRPVLPVIVAAERDEAVARLWADLVGQPEPELGEQLAAMVRDSGALTEAREVMARECWAAQRALRTLPESPYRTAMEQLAEALARPV